MVAQDLTFRKKNSIHYQKDKFAKLTSYELELITKSAQQTQELGLQLGKGVIAPVCLALSGELGVGKTCLAQGILRGLGVEHTYITSPSYTIINQYQSPKGPVFHCDLYRLTSVEQVYELGWEEHLEEGITLIEWPEAILSELDKAEFLYIKIERLGEDDRRIKLIPHAEKYNQLLEKINQLSFGRKKNDI